MPSADISSRSPKTTDQQTKERTQSPLTTSPGIHPDDFRRIKWEYVIPIVFTPSAHIFVPLIRKYPQQTKKLAYGVVAATFLTIQTRMILMYDAGYPGAEKPNKEGLPAFLRFFLF